MPTHALSQLGAIRLGLAAIGILLLLFTFEAIRRTALKERYAMLWFGPCLILLTLTIFPGALNWMRDVFGLTYASSVSCVLFLALLAAFFCFSCAISKNERSLARVVQHCASLEARIRELEKKS